MSCLCRCHTPHHTTPPAATGDSQSEAADAGRGGAPPRLAGSVRVCSRCALAERTSAAVFFETPAFSAIACKQRTRGCRPADAWRGWIAATRYIHKSLLRHAPVRHHTQRWYRARQLNLWCYRSFSQPSLRGQARKGAGRTPPCTDGCSQQAEQSNWATYEHSGLQKRRMMG